MSFLNEAGVTALWGKCKAWFGKTISVSGATVTLKNNAGDILSQATIPDATTSTAGLMSAQDKARVDGLVASGGEPNQNAFAKVSAGGTAVEADAVSDTLTIAAGANVTVSANASTDTVTISATDTTYSTVSISQAGLMTPAMMAKLGNIEDGANKTVVDSALSTTSENPVQNKVLLGVFDNVNERLTELDDWLENVDAKLSGIEEGANKTVVDSAWNTESTNPLQNKVVAKAIDELDGDVSDLGDRTTKAESLIADHSLLIATKASVEYVDTKVAAAQVGAAVYQGAAATNDTISGSDYKKGWYWVVSAAGTFAGQACEAGDMVFANSDKGSAYSASHFDVVQANIQAMTAAEVEAICS